MLLSVVYALLCGKHHPAAVAGWVEAHYSDWLRDTLDFPQPLRPCRTTYYCFSSQVRQRVVTEVGRL